MLPYRGGVRLSRVQQTLMLVNAPRAYNKSNFSFKLDNKLRRQISLTSIETVLLGRIVLVGFFFQPRIKLRSVSEVSKCSMNRFILDH